MGGPQQVEVERESGSGFPELTALGKRIEVLRIERGLSKQLLARGAGTSRQQLWRVMTGKSELTSTLGQRLAEVLQVDARILRGLDTPALPEGFSASTTSGHAAQVYVVPRTLAEFLADPAHLDRAVQSLPADEHGMRLRLALLDAVGDAATIAGLVLDARFEELRRRALSA